MMRSLELQYTQKYEIQETNFILVVCKTFTKHHMRDILSSFSLGDEVMLKMG